MPESLLTMNEVTAAAAAAILSRDHDVIGRGEVTSDAEMVDVSDDVVETGGRQLVRSVIWA